MNDKEQERQAMIEDARQAMIDAIDDDSVSFATPEQRAETGDYIDWQLIADMVYEEDEVCPKCGCVESGCHEVGCMSEEWEDDDEEI